MDNENKEKSIKKISIYNLINGMISNAYSPFVSFIGASIGLPGYLLGLVTTSGTFFTNLFQYISSLTKSRAKTLILAGNLIKALSLLILFFTTSNGFAYTILIALIMSGSGISGFGVSLLNEYYSRGSRSVILSRIAFYSSLGSVLTVMLGGLYMATNALLVKYIFLISSIATLASTFLISNLFFANEKPNNSRKVFLDRNDFKKLRKFLIFNLIYMLTWSFAWPLFPVAQIYIFHMTTFQVAIINLIALSSTIAVQRVIGLFIAKHLKLSMFLGRLTNTFFALAYALSPNYYGIYAAQLIAGLTNSINNVAYFSYLVDNSENKRAGIGTYSIIMGFGALIGGEIGGLTYDIIEPRFGYEYIRKIFLYVAVARASAASLFLLI
ncbi:MAG: MFS transporter [Caldisphaera sp.]|jgi:MFS family permease